MPVIGAGMNMTANSTLVPAAASRLSVELQQNASIDRILNAARKHLGTEIAFVARF